MTRPVLLVDTETTALSPERGEVWEIAVIHRGEDGKSCEYLWRVEPDLASAEPKALEVGRHYERTAGTSRHSDRDLVCDLMAGYSGTGGYWSSGPKLAPVLARLLSGATIAAANPTFDAGFLAAFLRRHGHAPTWHYRLRDIGSMAYGFLQGRSIPLAPQLEQALAAPHPVFLGAIPPIDASTDDFAHALGIDVAQFERHSALGDCRLLGLMLDIIEGRTS